MPDLRTNDPEAEDGMCGRYESWVDDDEVTEVLELEKQGSAARYLRQTEVFPGTVQPVLFGSRIRMRAHLSKWGLPMPIRADGSRTNGIANTARREQLRLPDAGLPDAGEDELSAPNAGQGRAPRTFINIRSETAAERARFSPAFRDPAFRESEREPWGRSGASFLRRVIVPTSGYYEWSGGVKYRISDRDGGLLLLAALEEDDGELLRENAPDPSKVYSAFSSSALSELPVRSESAGDSGERTIRSQPNPGRRHGILTTEAAGEPARIHTRMPLFLRREECEAWLYDPDFARMRLKKPWSGTLVLRAAEA